jgi:hypothetical protein
MGSVAPRFHSLPVSRHGGEELFAKTVRKFFPEIAQQVDLQLQQINQTFFDYSLIETFLEDFCRFRKIEPRLLKGPIPKMSSAMQERRAFLALIILLYQPQKLHGYSQRNVVQGLLTQVAGVLDCSRLSLANVVPELIVHFKRYQPFRKALLETQQFILSQHTP